MNHDAQPTAVPPVWGWTECLSLLRTHGFTPARILDVGANRGGWARAAAAIFPEASFVLVEPQDHLRTHIEDLASAGIRITWLTAGMSDRPGRLMLTLSPDEVSSNFGLSADEAGALGFRQVPVDIRTIDEIVETVFAGAAPELVKIDAEGFDLKALAGASGIMGKTDVFFVEAAVCATGIDNTMATVVSTMDALGYKVIDITDLNRSPKFGVLWLCELVFMRTNCRLLESVSSYR